MCKIKRLSTSLIMATLMLSMLGCSDNLKDTSSSDENSNTNEAIITEEEKIVETFSYSSIPENIKKDMLGKSMPSHEPLSFDNLSYLRITYYGFDEKTHIGEMVVDKRVAAEVVDIFEELYKKKYPFEKIKLIDEYDAIDESSMSDNNSSSFCYRTIANTNTVSNHGKGLAIDINPLQNPHVIGNKTSPESGYAYSDRSNTKMGMIQVGDDCYNAFTSRGWSWGGHWKNPDYQHFEKSI